ncbi:hypothetical protein Taro_036618 [Colocasia esculenta]|uniref:Uncharacterized protein n=1 Tax=Colocasia esculenta TaxID=4460 RepID=A0A843W3J0_COLES|nr:hypothetical protein [Colocasia esculenta]
MAINPAALPARALSPRAESTPGGDLPFPRNHRFGSTEGRFGVPKPSWIVRSELQLIRHGYDRLQERRKKGRIRMQFVRRLEGIHKQAGCIASDVFYRNISYHQFGCEGIIPCPARGKAYTSEDVLRTQLNSNISRQVLLDAQFGSCEFHVNQPPRWNAPGEVLAVRREVAFDDGLDVVVVARIHYGVPEHYQRWHLGGGTVCGRAQCQQQQQLRLEDKEKEQCGGKD